MAVSYKKLWKLLIDRDMKKKDLCEAAGISHASVAKLGKNENPILFHPFQVYKKVGIFPDHYFSFFK